MMLKGRGRAHRRAHTRRSRSVARQSANDVAGHLAATARSDGSASSGAGGVGSRVDVVSSEFAVGVVECLR